MPTDIIDFGKQNKKHASFGEALVHLFMKVLKRNYEL